MPSEVDQGHHTSTRYYSLSETQRLLAGTSSAATIAAAPRKWSTPFRRDAGRRGPGKGEGPYRVHDYPDQPNESRADGGVGVARGCSWKNRANSRDASGPAGSV